MHTLSVCLVYMGKVFRFRHISLIIRTHDHEPPHIHAEAPGAEAKIRIDDGYVYFSRGYTKRMLELIKEQIEQRKELLKEKWYEIHAEKKE